MKKNFIQLKELKIDSNQISPTYFFSKPFTVNNSNYMCNLIILSLSNTYLIKGHNHLGSHGTKLLNKFKLKLLQKLILCILL
jgi:hypothetical protein